MFIANSETFETCEKVMTFDGATANDPGNLAGTGNPATLFTVTGVVAMKLFAICETTCTGATATLEVGTALLTTGIIVLTTATNLAVNEIWHDATPDSSIELTTVAPERIVKQNVIQTVRTANVTAGKLRYVCLWRPLSANAKVAAA